MSVVAVPTLGTNQGNAPGGGKQKMDLVHHVDWKVGNVGDHANVIAQHLTALYVEHNKLVKHVDQVSNTMLKELNASLIEAIAPQISDRAKELIASDSDLVNALAKAVIANQKETMEKCENRIRELENRIKECERARL